jgi:hypothetical protein
MSAFNEKIEARQRGKKLTAIEKSRIREQLTEYWVGRFRYTQTEEDGVKVVLPEFLFTSWYIPEGIVREVCVALDKDNMPIWQHAPDAPVPPEYFIGNSQGEKRALFDDHPAAQPPPFDYKPPAYARDTHSGGPHNFDGVGGAGDNPRNPDLEGEVPGQYQAQLDEYKTELLALRAQVLELQGARTSPDDLVVGE